MGIFGECQPSGPWAPTTGATGTTTVALTFDRFSAGFDTQYREPTLSWVASFSITGDLQPATFMREIQRAEHGILAEAAYVFEVNGNPDIRIQDRTIVSAAALEVVQIDRYGTIRADCFLRWLR